MYTAILLDEMSQARLKQKFDTFFPSGWKVFCHHVTLNMGSIEKGVNDKSLLGSHVSFFVDAFGKADKVCAVRVSEIKGAKSVNKVAHVTLAVDQINGGKPSMSKDIAMWIPVNEEEFFGIIAEVGLT